MGVFEVTQKQWSLIIGDRPSFWKGPQWSVRPVEQVTYDRIRGENLGRKWPESDEVDEISFMGLLRKKTGLRFDLPREAQWEYACRAGTTTIFHNNCEMVDWRKDPSLDKIARYQGTGCWDEEKWGKFDWGKAWSAPDRNCGTDNGTAAVGSYQHNNWGLYDTLGNVAEFCLDCKDATNAQVRVVRGGYWAELAYVSTTHWRHGFKWNEGWFGTGFRLCLPLTGGAAVPVANNSTPKIVGVSPANGDQAIDAGVGEVVVRFDRPMQTGLSLTGFDWPKIAVGEPKWDETMTTLRVSVNLKPMATYRLGFNSRSHMNFRSKEGAPLAPYTHVFRTK